MIDSDRIIDLKEEPAFIEQYVNLRNGYCDVLLTSPINVADTRIWLQRDDIEIRGIVRGHVLAGVVMLFLSRKGEIAFFTKHKGAGLGSRLLGIIEVAAMIDAHRKHLEETGKLHKKRRARIVERIHDLVSERLRVEFWTKEREQFLKSKIDTIVQQQTTPYDVVEELLNNLNINNFAIH